MSGKNLMIEPDMIRMEGPIKEIALYAVKVHLGYEIESEVKVLVVRPSEKK
jgi:large subunit ribosomal protein L9